MTEVAIIMGSSSDWATMKETAKILDDFGLAYEKKVVSAHRTPALMAEFSNQAHEQGCKVIIAGAGGAAHLPVMLAAQTLLRVIGLPIKSRALTGLDSLNSIDQKPAGVPVATMAIGEAGAKNAALFALQLLANNDDDLYNKLVNYRAAAQEMVEQSNNELK